MRYMRSEFKDVKFSLVKDKPNIKIDYVQYIFINKSNRIDYITLLQAIWHYDSGDLIYFNSNNFKIYYDKN